MTQRPESEADREKEDSKSSLFMTWPFNMVGPILNPWQGLAAVISAIGIVPEAPDVFPKTQSDESESAYSYLVFLPDITRDQISLRIRNRSLVLRVMSGGIPYRRAFTIPVYTDGKAITAALKNGVLTIVIPKHTTSIAPTAHSIDIN